MDIVFVIPSLKTGGGNRVFFELANCLCKRYGVTVMYPYNSEEVHTFYIHPAVRLEAVGGLAKGKIGKLLNVLKCIRRLNRSYRNSVKIITDPLFSIFAIFLNSSHLYRFIQADDYRIYDDGMVLGRGIILKVYKQLCLLSYRCSIKYIFNSLYIYNTYCEDSKRKDQPYQLVYPALNQDVFRKRNTPGDKDERVTISLVARKHPLKGLITFLHVFHRLPVFIRNKIKQVILISHDDLSGFDTKGMEVVKPASDEEMALLYAESDIFISTSWWEGFGLPPLEAMACGCAVITSDSGGVNEYAVAEENCLMFPPKDEDALQKQLCRLVENPVLRDRLVKAGLQTAASFDWQKSAAQLLKIIEN